MNYFTKGENATLFSSKGSSVNAELPTRMCYIIKLHCLNCNLNYYLDKLTYIIQ